MVEPHVANVIVAGSSPVSRSTKQKLKVNPALSVINLKILGGIAKWLRQRSAKPLFTSSNLVAASSN